MPGNQDALLTLRRVLGRSVNDPAMQSLLVQVLHDFPFLRVDNSDPLSFYIVLELPLSQVLVNVCQTLISGSLPTDVTYRTRRGQDRAVRGVLIEFCSADPFSDWRRALFLLSSGTILLLQPLTNHAVEWERVAGYGTIVDALNALYESAPGVSLDPAAYMSYVMPPNTTSAAPVRPTVPATSIHVIATLRGLYPLLLDLREGFPDSLEAEEAFTLLTELLRRVDERWLTAMQAAPLGG